MLLACSACHRQYDVGDLAPGRKVRCTCGVLTEIPRRRTRHAETAHCGSCGAALGRKGAPCDYCGARVTEAEEGFAGACPECFARLTKSARFCTACGLALRPEARLQAVTRTTCPRCAERLAVTEGKSDPHHQCTACGGIWISRRAFERFADRARARGGTAEERRAVAREVAMRRKPRERRPLLNCPVCGGVMGVQEYAGYSGVLVDVCLAHGWWFDAGELARVGRYIAHGGLEETERRRRANRRVRRTVQSWRRRIAAEERSGLLNLLLEGG